MLPNDASSSFAISSIESKIGRIYSWRHWRIRASKESRWVCSLFSSTSNENIHFLCSTGSGTILQQRKTCQYSAETIPKRSRGENRWIQFDWKSIIVRNWWSIALGRTCTAKGSNATHHWTQSSESDDLCHSGQLLGSRHFDGSRFPWVQHQVSQSEVIVRHRSVPHSELINWNAFHRHQVHQDVQSSFEQFDYRRMHVHVFECDFLGFG